MSDKLILNVIGDPIEHSKSPVVHGLVLDALGVDSDYSRVLVKKGGLSEYVENAVKSGVRGFNLTMPHKVDIIPFLKEIDKDAELFGAVNTVSIKGGELYGYNTDARGFVLSLEQNGVDISGKSIVIFGAGGVVSTLALKLSDMGAGRIAVLNRTPEKAGENVYNFVKDLTPEKAEAVCEKIRGLQKSGAAKSGTELSWGETNEVEKRVPDCDILINATPLGMSGVGADYEDLSFIDRLDPNASVIDLIYSPPKTKFLAYAEKRGHKIINGLGMLIGQAILADEIYLDKKLDISGLYTKLTSGDYTI